MEIDAAYGSSKVRIWLTPTINATIPYKDFKDYKDYSATPHSLNAVELAMSLTIKTEVLDLVNSVTGAIGRVS